MLKNKKIFGHILMFLLLCSAFLYNEGIADKSMFHTFQHDSESLVIGKILADKYDIESKYNLIITKIDNNLVTRSDLSNNVIKDSKSLTFNDYNSQYGLQGKILSWIYLTLNGKGLLGIYIFCSSLLALAIMGIFLEYSKFSKPFAFCIYLSILFSPWIVSFARNLYWVPATWFFPSFFSLILIRHINTSKAYFVVFLIYLSFTIKCLCGYEYISSIILMSALPFIYLYTFPSIISKKTCIKLFILVCFLGVLGFCSALLMHASLRGDTIAEGLHSIYRNDVLRRTYADPSMFDKVYYESLSKPVLSVLNIYFTQWKTNILSIIPTQIGWFCIMILPLSALAYKFKTKNILSKKLFILYIYSLSIPLSWFILAKAHSYIHTHMNYVLWYMGFIPVCLYILYRIFIEDEAARKKMYYYFQKYL